MICSRCKKENSPENKFCKYCGFSLKGYQPPQPSNQYNNLNAVEYLLKQKDERTIKFVKKMTAFSSVLWLISGILFYMMSIGYICAVLIWGKLNENFSLYIMYPIMNTMAHKISYLLLRLLMILIGSFGIYNFCRNKNLQTVLYKKRKAKQILAVQIICFVSFVLKVYKGPRSLYNLTGMFGYKWWLDIRNLIDLSLQGLITNIVNVVLIVIFLLPAAASVIDCICSSKAEKEKRIFDECNTVTYVKRKPLTGIALVILICIAFSSIVLFVLGEVTDKKYNDERELIIWSVKNGYLNENDNKCIEDCVDKTAKKIKGDDDWSVWWDYDKKDPKNSEFDYNIFDGKNNSYRYVEAVITAVDDYSSDVNITFCIDTKNGGDFITVDKIAFDDDEILPEDKEKFIEEFFGRGNAYARGIMYTKTGVYVDDTESLYGGPDYTDESGYTFAKSGVKPIYDFKIYKTNIRSTLWLKVKVDGEYYWIRDNY